jgi:hypothetical protein
LSPVTLPVFLVWGGSHYEGPREDLEAAFRGLLAQGLFFEVHPGVFAEPVYCCGYDQDFLAELPEDAPERREGEKFWPRWNRYHVEHTAGWQSAGLCMGQGSQSGGSERFGVCLGTSCCSFDGGEACTWELEFNPALLRYAPKD